MKKISTILIASATLLLGSVNSADHKSPHWGYTGHDTPDTWGSLSEEYRECGSGLNQSPINITHSIHASLPPLSPVYEGSSREILDNGHTIQVNMDSGSYVETDGIRFELKQFHFHAPSENHIEGKEFPLEAHFVNVDKEGNIAVLAVMFELGAENKQLARFWSLLPSNEGEKLAMRLSDIAKNLLPQDKHYYRFNGSLTTPPCTEGVRWFVFKETQTISEEQVGKFHSIMHGDNNRPIQPIDARIIVD